MKKKSKVLMGILASLALFAVGMEYWLVDGLAGSVWGIFLEEDTEYADGYRDKRWREVYVGMAQDHVLSLMGEPLDSWTRKDGRVDMR